MGSNPTPSAMSTGTSTAASGDDERFMSLALDQACAAEAHGDVPVGAVVVREGIVIAARHNERELTGDPTAHAEVRPVARAAAHASRPGKSLL